MGYFSDPTAAKAIGEIDREFSRLEKKAKRLKALLAEGKVTSSAIDAAQAEYKGIYRHVLQNTLKKQD